MIHTDLLVVGAGPAGLSAAIEAARSGLKALLIDRNNALGGQLIKQTHMFSGAGKQFSSLRGFEIANKLIEEISELPNVETHIATTVLAAYDDGIWTADIGGKYEKIKPRAVVVATGASEKTMSFPGNDIPGIYGAGAMQTLMNQYGIMPAKRVIMLGSSNIGLIVSYQLMQAGVEVVAVVESEQKVKGFDNYAANIRKLGIPIITGYGVKSAHGADMLEGATIWKLDEQGQGIPLTERKMFADTLCVAAGLSPLTEILWQAGCKMEYNADLGGHVPVTDENFRTSVENVFACGDVAGVSDAGSALIKGKLAGLSAVEYLGCGTDDLSTQKAEAHSQLKAIKKVTNIAEWIPTADHDYSDDKALVELAYDFLPIPKIKESVLAIDKDGVPIAMAEVVEFSPISEDNKIPIVRIAVDKTQAKLVRHIAISRVESNVVCRCHDVDLQGIRLMISRGHTSVDELKRVARLGMGPCQGRNCVPIILNELSDYLGVPISELNPGTYRPMVKSVAIGDLADYDLESEVK